MIGFASRLFEWFSMKANDLRAGRLYTKTQLTLKDQAEARILEVVEKHQCPRCGTPFDHQAILPNGKYYCRACISFGRVQQGDSLYYFPAPSFASGHYLRWKGTLTDDQQVVSKRLCQKAVSRQNTLVYAVTGAGKTEMLYETLAHFLDRGNSVCLASPRRDVCIELSLRLQRDFSCEIVLLHGDQPEYHPAPLVIATTHQLVKFREAFDLLVIDEVDAFPYVHQPFLQHAARHACKTDGVLVYLTATSTNELDWEVKKGNLSRLSLPRRFHGKPLVVPQWKFVNNWQKKFAKGRLPRVFRKDLFHQQITGHPLLIFVPTIEAGIQLAEILATLLPQTKLAAVSSQTENRKERIEEFREGKLQILITTTILERGVTFPGVDVFVIQADHFLFNQSSLIQIAGRVGRTLDRPEGILCFYSGAMNKEIRMAIDRIRKTNQEAGF